MDVEVLKERGYAGTFQLFLLRGINTLSYHRRTAKC